ncbi:MAG: PAS domain S-box protein, partial [Anaerolineales bacterium]
MKDKNREREKLANELEKAKKKLEKLKDWEARYKALFDRSLYYVFVHDLEGNYIDANKAALNLLGYKKKDIPHLDFASLLDE